MTTKPNTLAPYDHHNTTAGARRREKNKELIDTAKRVCREHGGMAEIGGGFVVVDTKKFKVSQR